MSHLDGAGAVGGADAGGHAEARVGIDADRVGRAARGGVDAALGLEVERITNVRLQRHTEHPPPFAQHKVDVLRRDVLGSADQIAFVLALLVIDQHHHAAAAEVFEDVRDGVQEAGVGFRVYRVSGSQPGRNRMQGL